MDQTETGESEPDKRQRVKLRRFTLPQTKADDSRPADIERVFDTYGIRNFKYQTWGRWEGSLPASATGVGVAQTTEDGMANQSNRAAPGGPYAWEMPEDLKMGALPLLARMPDATSLVARLRLGGQAPRRVSTEQADTQSVLSRAKAVAAQEKAPVAAKSSAAPDKAPASDARSRLRELALKGQTNG